ncbi:MAG: PQ-loop domain-containing transporter [bacterium]|nr:PQ-loop domain-containing transporter [bacterium]
MQCPQHGELQLAHEEHFDQLPQGRRKFDSVMTWVASISAVSNLPQVIKIWTRHSAADISLGTYGIAIASLVFWIAYGSYIKSKPIILGSSISLFLSLAVLIQFFVYK